MSLADDIAGDFADLVADDGAAAVVFRQTRKDGRRVECRIAHALRHQLSTKEAAASFGRYRQGDVVFNAPVAELDVEPFPGDKILEERTTGRVSTLTILSVDTATLRSRYRLTCRDLVLAENLRDLITIKVPKNNQDAAAGRVPTFRPAQIGVAARIQEVSGEAIERHGKRAYRREYRIYCGDRVYASPQDQIEDQNGLLYDYIRDEGMDTLDVLQVIVAERVE